MEEESISWKQIAFVIFGFIVISIVVCKCNYNDGQFSRSLYMNNVKYPPVIIKIDKYEDAWEYTIKSVGVHFSYETPFVDYAGRFKVGDTVYFQTSDRPRLELVATDSLYRKIK
jgi:hypothetical protein